MRFTPEQHLKAAALMSQKAKETSDPERKKRREELANAHRLLARKRHSMDNKQLPIGPMLDDPNPFGTLESLERHLTEVQSLPPSLARNGAIRQVRQYIAAKKRHPTTEA